MALNISSSQRLIIFITLYYVIAVSVIRGECNDGDVRLVGSPRSIEGRVEVENQGSWGSVCSNGWDHSDARVVCRQLGYINGAMLAGSTDSLGFLPGTSPVYLTGLECVGSESRLSDCPGYQIRTNTFRGACMDAAVVCQLPEYSGCFSGVNAWNRRASVSLNMGTTIDRCLTSCVQIGNYQYARLSGGELCQCSNTSSFGSRVPDDSCSIPCTGSPRQACGGTSSNGIYSYYPTSLGSNTGSYIASFGIIVSPNFPGFYRPGVDGRWTITFSSPRTLRFTFEFIDLFIDDSVEIASGNTLVKLEHDETQLEYTLQGSRFEVRFSVDSNSDETNAGFLLRYADLNIVPTIRPMAPTVHGTIREHSNGMATLLIVISVVSTLCLVLVVIVVVLVVKKLTNKGTNRSNDLGLHTHSPASLPSTSIPTAPPDSKSASTAGTGTPSPDGYSTTIYSGRNEAPNRDHYSTKVCSSGPDQYDTTWNY